MAKKTNADDALWTLLNDNTNFASIFNAYFFDGEPVVHPEDLHELNSRAQTELSDMTTLLKEADIGKIWITGDKEQILLIENHAYVDYGMAVRETESQAAFLGNQRAMLISKNRNEGNTDSKTYLSGMLPTDQIMPVYVLTIYYGAPAWDASLNVEELYTPHVDMGPRLNKEGVTLLEVRNARLKGLSPAMKDLFDLLQLRYATTSSDFPAQYAKHLTRHDVAPEAVNAFSRLIGSKAVRRLYDKLQKKKKEGENMSLSIAEWEREWVEEIHPEWIEVHDADQKKIKDLESENGNLVSKNKQLESDFEQLARFIVPGFIEEGRAAHTTEVAIIETIVSKTGVSEETARRLVSEYRGHKS